VPDAAAQQFGRSCSEGLQRDGRTDGRGLRAAGGTGLWHNTQRGTGRRPELNTELNTGCPRNSSSPALTVASKLSVTGEQIASALTNGMEESLHEQERSNPSGNLLRFLSDVVFFSPLRLV